MYAEISVAHFVMTEVAQPLQRGSLASSHAKTAGDDEYRDTTALIYVLYCAWAAVLVNHVVWEPPKAVTY